jgi:hypothetical protein
MNSANIMTRKSTGLSRRYQAALRKHPTHGSLASSKPAQRLGRQPMHLGHETLDLARIHEQALITLELPSYSARTRNVMVRRAGALFVEAITPIEHDHRAGYGKEIPVESSKRDVGAFASQSGRV